jgi:hypothetical protein
MYSPEFTHPSIFAIQPHAIGLGACLLGLDLPPGSAQPLDT